MPPFLILPSHDCAVCAQSLLRLLTRLGAGAYRVNDLDARAIELGIMFGAREHRGRLAHSPAAINTAIYIEHYNAPLSTKPGNQNQNPCKSVKKTVSPKRRGQATARRRRIVAVTNFRLYRLLANL